MADSFARRRIRFDYLKEHQKKRTIEQEQNTFVPPHRDIGQAPGLASVKQAAPNKAGVIIPSQSLTQDHGTIYKETVDTKHDEASNARWQEREESVASIALRHHEFPPPPKITSGVFQCPYCRLQFREREARRDRWRQHVMQDFEPYFCNYKYCATPFDVPNTFDGLLNHMQDHIPVRYDVEVNEGTHKEVGETDFEELVVERSSEVSRETMVTMKEASRSRSVFLFTSCPFCGGYPNEVEERYPERNSIEAQTALRKHIKGHMHEISLFLPPYRSDIAGEEDECNSSAVTRQSFSRDNLGEPQEHRIIGDNQDCDCKQGSWCVADAFLVPDLFIQPGVDYWQDLLDSFIYDHSKISDDYYRNDKRLRDFVARWEQDKGSKTQLYSAGKSDAPPQIELELIPPFVCMPTMRQTPYIENEDLLTLIGDKFVGGRWVALLGLSGIGKTQIAVEFCDRLRGASPQMSIFWVNARDSTSYRNSFQYVAKAIGIHDSKTPDADVVKLVYDWLRERENGRWLLVVDNADDVSPLIPYPPQDLHGSVLLIGSSKDVIKMVKPSKRQFIIRVHPMDDGSARSLLQKHFKRLGLQEHGGDSISELAAALDFIPRALVLAAHHIHDSNMTIRGYLEKFSKDDQTREDLLRDKHGRPSMIETWQKSLDYLQSQNPSAVNLLSLMSLYDGHEIPFEAVRGQYHIGDSIPRGPTSQLDAKRGYSISDHVGSLKVYCFITVFESRDSCRMPSLVQLATRQWLKRHQKLEFWKERFIVSLCIQFGMRFDHEWQACCPLFPHAIAAFKHKPDSDDTLKIWAELLYYAAWYANHIGKSSETEYLLLESIHTREVLFGKNSKETSDSISMLAWSKRLQENHVEANELDASGEEILRILNTQNEPTKGKQHDTYGELTPKKNFQLDLLFMDSKGHQKPAVGYLDASCEIGNCVSSRFVESLNLAHIARPLSNRKVGISADGRSMMMNEQIQLQFRGVDGARLYSASFLIFPPASIKFDVILGTEFITQEKLLTVDSSPMVPLRKLSQTEKNEIATAKEKQRQEKKALEARRNAMKQNQKKSSSQSKQSSS